MRKLTLHPILTSLLFFSLCLASCNESVQVQGNKITVDINKAVGGAFHGSGSSKRDFIKITPQYPSGWPAELKLPAEFYSANGSQLEAGPAPARGADPIYDNVKTIRFNGLTKGKPSEVAAFFKNQLDKAGWQEVSLRDTGAMHFPGTDSPGSIGVSGKPPSGSQMDYFLVKVENYRFGDWVHISGWYGFE